MVSSKHYLVETKDDGMKNHEDYGLWTRERKVSDYGMETKDDGMKHHGMKDDGMEHYGMKATDYQQWNRGRINS